MVLINRKVTKNTENQEINKQPPLPTGRGVDNQIVTIYPPSGEGLGVGQKQYYATYVY